MQRHELEAWLGDDHGLTEDQITDLLRTAGEIGDRYPDPDDQHMRDAALTIAYRLMVEDPSKVTADLADELLRARLAESRALAGIRQGALTLVRPGDRSVRGIRSQLGYANRVGVHQSAVRDWLGQRDR